MLHAAVKPERAKIGSAGGLELPEGGRCRKYALEGSMVEPL